MSHSNISIFVPHLGCPNQCSFCDQRSITGQHIVPVANDVQAAVETALKSPKFDSRTSEIAFFGGSFTAIDREYMLQLLKAAHPFVESGYVKGIRVSTRPDAINTEVLELLKTYGVTAIELGAQSMCDDVLALNGRGHTALDVEKASELIKRMGFELGLQMMTGLYGSNAEKDRFTAEKIIDIHPKTVRIYPTVTLENTRLAALYRSLKYQPPSLEETVELCAELKPMFQKNGIKVIRVGLHAVDKSAVVAGPWHPSFGELVESRIMYKRAVSRLGDKGEYILTVNPSSVSKMVGQKRENILRLKKLGYICRVSNSPTVKGEEIEIRKDGEICI